MIKPGTRLWKRIAWPIFRLGYITALDDIQRTGLQPKREDTKETAAKMAFERLVKT